MAWKDLPSNSFPQRAEEPLLRILNRRQGYLNVEAREYLFGGAKEGRVKFREGDPGPGMCLEAAKNGEGIAVRRDGHLAVAQLMVKRPGATVPVALRLRPEAENGVRRLILAGVA